MPEKNRTDPTYVLLSSVVKNMLKNADGNIRVVYLIIYNKSKEVLKVYWKMMKILEIIIVKKKSIEEGLFWLRSWKMNLKLKVACGHSIEFRIYKHPIPNKVVIYF
jgi:hypothetical protein